MKSLILSFLTILMWMGISFSQPVNGIIYADTSNIKVIKLWGTHQERGYALGYLLGEEMTEVMVNYIQPQFGVFYPAARNVIIQGVDIEIPQKYKDEAQAIIDGMNAAGTNPENLDQTDVLVGNAFLDIANTLFVAQGPGCSSLMSWNDATAGTDLDGKSVISRHMDWEVSSILYNNNVIIVHFPSEADEYKWMLVGYAGMMSALSGVNEDFGAFQHQMDDNSAMGLHNKQYMPIWFALREALEADDYNGDGARDVNDIRAVLNGCANGFADGFIISALARSVPEDSLVALVAELTPSNPTHTFRTNAYPDSIPGDNLYTANYQIARNHMMHFCPRYNAIKQQLGEGTMIGLDTNWNMMRDYSHLPHNMQFMEYAPEISLFRMSVYGNGQPAYMNDPIDFDLIELFSPVVSVEEHDILNTVVIFPNPASGKISFSGIPAGDYTVEILDSNGVTRQNIEISSLSEGLDISALPSGLYTIRLIGAQHLFSGKVIITR